jgi:hypothetical protein
VTKINPHDIGPLLNPWAGLADDGDEIERYAWVDPNDESSIRRVIVQDIVPHVATWDVHRRELTKLALQCALTFATDWFFERSFDSNLPPFEAPTPTRRLFEIVWEELFDGEDYRLPGTASDHVSAERLDPNLIRMSGA